MTVQAENPVFSELFQPWYRPVCVSEFSFLFGLDTINLYNINRKAIIKLFLSSQSGNVYNDREKKINLHQTAHDQSLVVV